MPYKTHFKNCLFLSSGLTLIELVIVVALISIMTGISYSLISSSVTKPEARDNRRMSDISNLDRAINEYRLDRGAYPGEAGVIYGSNTLPVGSTAIYNANMGWIKADLAEYLAKSPIDPTNDVSYHYEYTHNVSGYEISSRLESLFDDSNSDGGNNSEKYELGNNLSLIP